MPELPHLSGREIIRALERLGFVQARQRGSHVVMKKSAPAGKYRLRRSLAWRGSDWDIAQYSQTSKSFSGGVHKSSGISWSRKAPFFYLQNAVGVGGSDCERMKDEG